MNQPRSPTAQAQTAEARFYALVPCAGIGERAGGGRPKQYADVAGAPMVAHTLSALRQVPRLHATLVVLAANDAQFEGCVPDFAGGKAWVARCGGASRASSVANGLEELRRRGADAADWVLVHDAARCLIRPEWVLRLIEACADDAVGGLLAMPVADTLKSAHEGRVAGTLNRAGKWAAQTPQMFRLGLLQQALRQALQQALVQGSDGVTDEAAAVEALGHAPLLVPGEAENFKLTWPGDLQLAARLLRTRGTELVAQ